MSATTTPPLSSFAQTLASSLAEAKLVPGPAEALIPREFTPTTRLGVNFDGREVDLGNLFRVREVKLAPFVSFEAEPGDSSADASYMLLLIDPDAPTPDDPKFAYWRHWVLPGLKPLASAEGIVAQTKPVLTEYLAPGPKDDSKPHRYLFLLFREPHGLDLAKEDVGGEEFVQRRSFDAIKFVERHQLQLVSVNWMKGAGDGWKE
ncbi:phosphatidylethanolamine-binding protein [Trichoderma austrokoningii]